MISLVAFVIVCVGFTISMSLWSIDRTLKGIKEALEKGE